MLKDALSSRSSYSSTLSQASRLAGELEFPLLPFGLSSPVSERVQSSHLAGLTLHLYKSFKYRTDITKRRTALTENPARAEEFGTRAPRPCLLNAPLALGTHLARRGVQAAVAPPVNAWLSGA